MTCNTVAVGSVSIDIEDQIATWCHLYNWIMEKDAYQTGRGNGAQTDLQKYQKK